jgi:hypothetical protein
VVLTYEDLTDPERAVWDAVGVGMLVKLPLDTSAADYPAEGGDWAADRQIRAQLLYELLTGRTGSRDTRPRALKLAGARVAGALDLEATTLICPLMLFGCYFEETVNLNEARTFSIRLPRCYMPGLTAAQLTTQGDLELNDGFTAHGGVDLYGAHISGRLNLIGATLTNPDGFALNADRLAVEQSMFCYEGFNARGEVRLGGAHVGGRLSFTAASLANDNGPALSANGLAVDRDMFCSEGFTARGEVSLIGAHIGGDLHLSGARLANPTGPALYANRLTVGQSIFCRANFTAFGEVRLLGAHIGGRLSFATATLTNRGGLALQAERLTVDQDLFFTEGFSTDGEVDLRGAQVRGNLVCVGARLTRPDGYALRADGLTVGQDALFTEGFSADGEVDLSGAHVGGKISFEDARLTNQEGWALYMQDTDAHTITLRLRVPPQGPVNFTRAHVRVLVDDMPDTWPESLWLRGFVYDALYETPAVDVATRLRWLDRDPRDIQPHGYSPQPYQQLAAVYRNAGRDEDARRVAIASQRRRRKELGLPGRLWGLLMDALVGYGYRTWRVGLWLLAFLVVGWVVFARAYPAHMTPTKPPGEPLPHFQPLIYALDTLLPVVDLHQQDNWIPRGWAQWWAWASILGGWVLTTAAVAALTGLIKKD